MSRSMPPRSEVVVAAFDLDGTLTEGGSVFGWLRKVAGTRTALRTVASMAPSMADAAVRGGSTADKNKERLFAEILRGRPLDEVRAVSAEYAAEHVASELRTKTKARLDWHVASGHHVVIVSASPALYVEPVGEALGVHGVVATNLAVDAQGRLTGRYDGKNCRGSEKFSRVTSWMRSEGLLGSSQQAPILWAYGNSRGDLRLLRAADHGVSCAKLGRLSKLSGFPSLDEVVAQTAGEGPA
jgi:HAD superfamily hydrolase (TIGR01490 family)